MLPSYENQASGARTWPGVSVKHLVHYKCPPWHQACLGPDLDLSFLPFLISADQGAHSLPAQEACHFLNTLHTFLLPSFCARRASPPPPILS